MLKNIIFDFGNVLIDFKSDKILNHYDLSKEEHELLNKAIFGSNEWLKIDAGELTEDEATEIFKKRLPERLHPQVEQIMQTWPAKVTFYPEMLDFMQKLHEQGYHLYALSNTGMRFANYLMNGKYGQYFEGEVFSAKEKLMKPGSEIYPTLLDRYNLDPSESLFIDDRPENIEAARKLGMHGFVFTIENLPELKEDIEELSK
ncbi:HAD family phosphatase [uncultured Lactobacillus sp.]|uniref:HAD family hydrolase n=1 Tax=uncultured Lactobacillus sp. TaxID=153152 RepID=UPI0028046BC5|nr:HAD family phosphatase [uncultured Lactobacillus sp.]